LKAEIEVMTLMMMMMNASKGWTNKTVTIFAFFHHSTQHPHFPLTILLEMKIWEMVESNINKIQTEREMSLSGKHNLALDSHCFYNMQQE
jgi:hypothetical protein